MTPADAPSVLTQRRTRFLRDVAALGLTDAQAARLLHVSKASWSEYRSGAHPVPRYIAQSLRFALALKVLAPHIYEQLLNETEKSPRRA